MLLTLILISYLNWSNVVLGVIFLASGGISFISVVVTSSIMSFTFLFESA